MKLHVSFAGMLLLAVALVGQASAEPTYPYTATVLSDQADILAGPGSWWYVTGTLNRGDRVKVLGVQFNWAQIEPPAGQFSLIRKEDVDVAGQTATVKGPAPAQVFAGSSVDRRSNRVQAQLAAGTIVTRLADRGEFYEIAPPPGATLFVKASLLGQSSDSVPVRTAPPPAEPVPDDQPDSMLRLPQTQPGDNAARVTARSGHPAAVRRRPRPTTQPTAPDPERVRYEQLKSAVLETNELLKAELTKPWADRNFAPLKQRFAQLKEKADKDHNPALLKWTEAVSQYLARLEAVQKQVAVSAEVAARMQEISRQAEAVKLQTPPPPGKYQTAGRLQRSDTFASSSIAPNMYKLIDDTGKTMCFVYPADSDADWSNRLGQPVRVTGERSYRPDWNFYLVKVEQLEAIGSPPPAAVTESDQPARQPPPQPPTPAPPELTPDIFEPRFEPVSAPATQAN